ncbi:hypothetical protein BRADI_3g10413v3 [Brachypodium distachyon]|uniref:Uncharacterized protein n=1 Tax=Brachypodium distachyon TaxID=15368 RepID=A0A2K2CWD6_BRADI|nr:hypothetical protein BRADI_3g10413v3 [Brachypodium distachyon]
MMLGRGMTRDHVALTDKGGAQKYDELSCNDQIKGRRENAAEVRVQASYDNSKHVRTGRWRWTSTWSWR